MTPLFALQDQAPAAAPDLAALLAELPGWARPLPTLNAVLNASAGVLLAFGLYFQRAGKLTLHRHAMLGAFGISVVFLVSYLTYHAALTGSTELPGMPFTGDGWSRPLYYTILATHVPLAAVVPVAAVAAIWLALKGRYKTHKKITRWLWPTWMYVSVTGVVIYGMLYHWPPGWG